MNDFTKDELELIKAYMFGGSYSISAKDLGVLEGKIQSLIDNYCDHSNRDWDIKGSVFECGDCKQDGGFE